MTTSKVSLGENRDTLPGEPDCINYKPGPCHTRTHNIIIITQTYIILFIYRTQQDNILFSENRMV